MCVQLAYTGGATGKHIKGRKGRTMLKILFITPEEIEGTLMTVGPKPSLFLYQQNKRPIYPTTRWSFVQILYMLLRKQDYFHCYIKQLLVDQHCHWHQCNIPCTVKQQRHLGAILERQQYTMYSNFRNYAPPPLDVKGGIITEKVFPVFSESFFGLVLAWSCTFGS